MQQRKQARARNREQCHRFRESIDAGAPLLFQEQQDRGDQRSRMADSNPPDEVDDWERPANGSGRAPDTDTSREEVARREEKRHQQQK
jgi:hypothetical protein